MTMRKLVDSCLAFVKPRIRWSTFDAKSPMLELKVKSYFARKLAGDVTSLDIIRWQGWIDSLRQRNGKPYSATYIRQLNS